MKSTRPSTTSLTGRALRLALVRIGLVSIVVGAISYYVNLVSIEAAVTRQLLLSTEQTLQREALLFQETKDLQKNFLAEFKEIYARPGMQKELIRDFEQIFYRHQDGSYTQRLGLFEGETLPDGRRFSRMSATYAPDIPPNDDTKARFALSYLLSHKYGSSAEGRLFNFYGVVPEKGFPIYQAIDIAKEFTYEGPQALKLETFEFYERGFGSASHETLFTQMYWDSSNKAWMTTIATPDVADAAGKHRILVCVDVLLDEFMKRTAAAPIQGAESVIFMADADGTLIYHPDHVEAIKTSEGKASIRSLKIENNSPLWKTATSVVPGKAMLVYTADDIIAQGLISGTPWVLAVHYPKALMKPAIFQNLAIVIALGFLTLLVEVFIFRSILQNQVAIPLLRLMHATKRVGLSQERLKSDALPIQSQDEIGELAREFASMASRVQDAQAQLEQKVHDRTVELEEANRQLTMLSATDALTGIANRRHFDEVFLQEWARAQRAGSVLSLAMIDVDWFKKYNDHYGHQAGDDCLRSVAKILKSHASRAGDLVARYGGEEFVVISTSVNKEDALHFANRLCQAFQGSGLSHASSSFGHVTVSIGMAVAAPADVETAELLLKAADEALYRAKAQGRNQAVLADEV